MPGPQGFSVTLSPFRRPSLEYAPTDAKAACHYPNSARALREARARGVDNAVMLEALITRNRVLSLLRRAGFRVHERALRWQEFIDADEVFSTGNFGKVMPIARVETRHLQPGPVFARARELYWAYAHGEKI